VEFKVQKEFKAFLLYGLCDPSVVRYEELIAHLEGYIFAPKGFDKLKGVLVFSVQCYAKFRHWY
jgi:hypothetical protein